MTGDEIERLDHIRAIGACQTDEGAQPYRAAQSADTRQNALVGQPALTVGVEDGEDK